MPCQTAKSIKTTREAARRAVMLPVYFYKKYISIYITSSCRFSPCCSEYFVQAVHKFGIFRGGLKGIWRILRCNPFFAGGWDPIEPHMDV